jgi:hypothetical protein
VLPLRAGRFLPFVLLLTPFTSVIRLLKQSSLLHFRYIIATCGYLVLRQLLRLFYKNGVEFKELLSPPQVPIVSSDDSFGAIVL